MRPYSSLSISAGRNVTAVPDWAFRYCGSTMEYTDAPDTDARLRGFLSQCEENGIRPGGFYLSSGYTETGGRRCVFCWNSEKIPSPEALAETFDAHGTALIPNVKPAFLTSHPHSAEASRFQDGSRCCWYYAQAGINVHAGFSLTF